MPTLVVVVDPKDWPLNVPGVEVVSASKYLTDSSFSTMRNTRVFNLCRSYRYQNNGYYVSLLATARGHRPLPSVTTIQDMKSATIIRSATGELDELVQKSLEPIQSDAFALSVYFGRNMAKRYQRLARELFNLFPSPLLRAKFEHVDDEWRLLNVRPISMNDVPAPHLPFLLHVAQEHFAGRRQRPSRHFVGRYDLAILHDPDAASGPSNERAIRKFVKAAERVGFAASFITKEDYGEVGEYDALFIRDTTFVNHYTYRFAAKAANEGLIVIDDPESIVRCTNKVYAAEMLQRHGISIPKTLVVHSGNVDRIIPELGLPCVLKQPDSAFSAGVVKVNTPEELEAETERLLEASDLIIAQAFIPTEFDWRIGVFDRKPLFAARYHMAGRHWQIVQRRPGRESRFGKVEAINVDDAPPQVIRTALRAANLIGDGLYGVDLKQFGRRVCVIEINDNPNIDAGFEDRVLGDELYLRIMQGFMRRVECRGKGPARYG